MTAINRKAKHIEPHLHNALEIVCVTSGTLELGVGQELYHMEKGDIGFVFPNVIHHYQVLTPGVNTVTYLIASPFTIAKFADIMQSMAPEYPIIKAEKVEPEVYRVINAILETERSAEMNNTNAKRTLALEYLSGEYLELDIEKGLKMLTECADSGDTILRYYKQCISPIREV